MPALLPLSGWSNQRCEWWYCIKEQSCMTETSSGVYVDGGIALRGLACGSGPRINWIWHVHAHWFLDPVIPSSLRKSNLSRCFVWVCPAEVVQLPGMGWGAEVRGVDFYSERGIWK